MSKKDWEEVREINRELGEILKIKKICDFHNIFINKKEQCKYCSPFIKLAIKQINHIRSRGDVDEFNRGQIQALKLLLKISEDELK